MLVFVVQEGTPFVGLFSSTKRHIYIFIYLLEPWRRRLFHRPTSVLTKGAPLDMIGLARRKGTSPRGEYSGL
jgi:hypothetical protein